MDLVCAASGQPDCLGDAVADRTATKRARILTHFTFLGFLQAVRVTMQRLGLAMVAARIVSPNGPPRGSGTLAPWPETSACQALSNEV